MDLLNGAVILIDKPYEWTSFDVIKKLKKPLGEIFRKQAGAASGKLRIGHAGTLDPLASGLLVICTGSKTKTIPMIQEAEKEYTGTLVLGASTASFDLETAIEVVKDARVPSEPDIRFMATQFIGKQEQTPPMHSAVKVEGQRAYTLARRGDSVVLKSKVIEIKAFDITSVRYPEVDFRIICSKGTYIRSIARDFGERLGSGAYLSALRRTRIGSFRVEDSLEPLDFLAQLPDL